MPLPDPPVRIAAPMPSYDQAYRDLADATPQLVWIARPDGLLDYVNERWTEYTGLDLEESRTLEAWRAVVHPDDLARSVEYWDAAKNDGTYLDHELRLRRASDRTYRWFVSRGVAVRDAEGAVRCWFGTMVDIEARRRLEGETARATTALTFLAKAGEVMWGARDDDRLFADVAHLCANAIADWCVIYVRDSDGAIRAASVAHADSERAAKAAELARRYPVRPHDPIAAVIASNRSELRPRLSPEELRAASYDARHFAHREALDLASAIAVPFGTRDDDRGAILLLRGAHGASYDANDLRVAEILAKRVALAYDNILHYRRQQRVVDTFQRAALPKSLPRIDGLALDAVYAAASEDVSVGGDWYDAFPLPDGKLVLTIGDVAGKGLDAAVLMATVRQSVRVAALQQLEPSAILGAADAALALEYPDRFVTALVAIVDPHTWTLSYASAGHPPALVRRPDGTLLELGATGLPLGAALGRPRRTRVIAGIPPGSLLVLYTDGLIEATHDVVDGYARLRAALARDAIVHAAAPAALIRDIVVPDGVRDDVAILTLSLGRDTHWSFESQDALAAQSARSSFVAALARDASPDSDLAAAEVIFGELIGNVVRYAQGPIDIDLEWTKTAPVLHVLDRGGGFDLRSTLPDDVMSEHGRGLYIVSVLGYGLHADRLPGRGNHVRVTLPVRRR